MTFPRDKPSHAALFFSFLALGATAFGGLAMMVYVKDLAVRKRWMDSETFNDGAVMCQALPGATVMMAVAYVGLKARGILGAWLTYSPLFSLAPAACSSSRSFMPGRTRYRRLFLCCRACKSWWLPSWARRPSSGAKMSSGITKGRSFRLPRHYY